MAISNEPHHAEVFRSRTHEATVAILRTADILRRRFGAALEPHGMTLQQYNVLRIIRDAGDEPIATLEIGARLIEQTPGITRLLDRLDDKGLVRRERGAGDRRIVHCWITARGSELLDRVDASMDAIHDGSLDGFDADDIDALLEMLEAIRIAAPSR